MATINGIVLRNFTFDNLVYQAGDKVFGVPERFADVGLVRVANIKDESEKSKKEEKVEQVILHDDTSDVEVVKEDVITETEEEPKVEKVEKSEKKTEIKPIKPLKKIKK